MRTIRNSKCGNEILGAPDSASRQRIAAKCVNSLRIPPSDFRFLTTCPDDARLAHCNTFDARAASTDCMPRGQIAAKRVRYSIRVTYSATDA